MTSMPWREGWEGEPAKQQAFPWLNPLFWLALWGAAYCLTVTFYARH